MDEPEARDEEKRSAARRTKTILFGIIISVLTGLIAATITNVFIYRYNTAMYPSRYDDARLVEKIEKDLSEGQNRFIVTQVEKANLHGLDHESLIACGYIESEQGVPHAKLAIYEKPNEDYNSVLTLSPVNISLPWLEKIAFETRDLNGDGVDELLISCFTSSEELPSQYVALVGWLKDYDCLWALPTLKYGADRDYLQQLFAAGITPHGFGDMQFLISIGGLDTPTPSIQLGLEQAGGAGTQVTDLGYCTTCEIRNIDGDPYPEILCADLIWAEGESYTDDHSCFLRVYEMPSSRASGHTAKVEPDYAWNGGKPLLWTAKSPARFEFTDAMINAGKSNGGK